MMEDSLKDPSAINLWFPVTEQEREELKAGKEILKHYHNVIFPDDTVAVVVGKPWDRSKYNYLLTRGIDIVPVELTDEQINLLDQQACVQKSKSPLGFSVNVCILDMEEFKKWRLKKGL